MFKKLAEIFGGGERQPADDGIYIHVKLHNKGEIVRLRLTPQAELVPAEDGGYKSHKSIVGPLTYERAEAVFHFDSRQNLVSANITGGELSTEEAYMEQLRERTEGSAGGDGSEAEPAS